MDMAVNKRRSWTFRSSRRFWLRGDLSLIAKGIGHVLLSFTDREGFAYPTTPQMATAAKVSEKTVAVYLQELRDAGCLTWTLFRDEHKQLRRMFNLNVPTDQGPARLFIPPSNWDGLGGQKYDGRRTMTLEPYPQKGV